MRGYYVIEKYWKDIVIGEGFIVSYEENNKYDLCVMVVYCVYDFDNEKINVGYILIEFFFIFCFFVKYGGKILVKVR